MTRFAVGDEVYGIGRGTFAEYAVAREDKLARKPANLTFEQAAVVPVSGRHRPAGPARRRSGRSRDSGCWSSARPAASAAIAVQIAKAFGAEVTGVCSAAKLDLVRSLGADHVIDYTREDFADGAGTTT